MRWDHIMRALYGEPLPTMDTPSPTMDTPSQDLDTWQQELQAHKDEISKQLNQASILSMTSQPSTGTTTWNVTWNSALDLEVEVVPSEPEPVEIFAEPILAYRVFRVARYLTRREGWHYRVLPLSAKTDEHLPDWNEAYCTHAKAHLAPAWDCRCGFWAMNDPLMLPSGVLGVVALAGSIVAHEDGYRASHMKILRLFVSTEKQPIITEDLRSGTRCRFPVTFARRPAEAALGFVSSRPQL